MLLYALCFIIGVILSALIVIILSLKKISQQQSMLDNINLQYSQAKNALEKANIQIKQLLDKQDTNQNEKIESASRISSLESKLDALEVSLIDKNKLIEQKENTLQLKATLEIDQQKRISELEVELQKTFENMEEKLKLLEQAKLDLTNNFKVLANDIFEEKSKRFIDINQNKIDDILKPFKTDLSDFKQRVEKVYNDESQQRASLKGELNKLFELNQQMNVEAQNLTRALKGNKQKQGAWGEFILEKVLETSGLRKDIEYETQVSIKDQDNQQFRPDVVVHLPDNRDVIIDSKVSLNAYESYVNGDDELERSKYLKSHVQAVKLHIESLSNKKYENLPNINSLDFILMFMPIESAFVAAFQHDESLFRSAFNKKIIVVTPTTLLATLGTIKNTWNYQNQNVNAQRIAADAGKMLDKFRGFVEDLEKIGSQISTVVKTYESAMNKLSKGKGNLINQTSKLQDLGVQMKKTIPPAILEQAEISEE